MGTIRCPFSEVYGEFFASSKDHCKALTHLAGITSIDHPFIKLTHSNDMICDCLSGNPYLAKGEIISKKSQPTRGPEGYPNIRHSCNTGPGEIRGDGHGHPQAEHSVIQRPPSVKGNGTLIAVNEWHFAVDFFRVKLVN
jgi:hypothetical protein